MAVMVSMIAPPESRAQEENPGGNQDPVILSLNSALTCEVSVISPEDFAVAAYGQKSVLGVTALTAEGDESFTFNLDFQVQAGYELVKPATSQVEVDVPFGESVEVEWEIQKEDDPGTSEDESLDPEGEKIPPQIGKVTVYGSAFAPFINQTRADPWSDKNDPAEKDDYYFIGDDPPEYTFSPHGSAGTGPSGTPMSAYTFHMEFQTAVELHVDLEPDPNPPTYEEPSVYDGTIIPGVIIPAVSFNSNDTGTALVKSFTGTQTSSEVNDCRIFATEPLTGYVHAQDVTVYNLNYVTIGYATQADTGSMLEDITGGYEQTLRKRAAKALVQTLLGNAVGSLSGLIWHGFSSLVLADVAGNAHIHVVTAWRLYPLQKDWNFIFSYKVSGEGYEGVAGGEGMSHRSLKLEVTGRGESIMR